MNPSLDAWARQASPHFQAAGCAAGFAYDCARLYVALWARGLNPRVTSLYRDPGKQRAMRAAWDRGDRAGLRARPADPDTSAHSKRDWRSRPAATGIDIVSSDERAAAAVARGLGIGAGADFRDPDMGHYYLR